VRGDAIEGKFFDAYSARPGGKRGGLSARWGGKGGGVRGLFYRSGGKRGFY